MCEKQAGIPACFFMPAIAKYAVSATDHTILPAGSLLHGILLYKGGVHIAGIKDEFCN